MSLFLFIPLFILAAFLAFYVPGRVVLGKQNNLSKLGLFVTSFILGIVLWGWQGYVFGFLHLRFLSYLYLLIFFLLFLKEKHFSFNIPKITLKTVDWITLGIMVVGVIGQTFQFVRMGQMTSLGLFISHENHMDQIWHAALVQEIVKRFPPNEPGMFGVPLLNYHFWFNLVTAEIVRVFHLPSFSTQFLGMHALGPILLALIAVAFAISVSKSKIFLRLFLFFLFFAGDMAAWFMLFLRHRFDFNVGWLFENGAAAMDAPGRGFAVIISLAGFYLLFNNKHRVSRRNIFIIGLLFGSLMGFKIYFAIPFLFGLFCFAGFNVIKKSFSYLWVFLIASFFFLLQFLPFNVSSGGLFFLPFDIPREFFAQSSLNLSYLDQRWSIYFDHHNYFRLAEYGILMSVGFLFIQFGIKIFGLFPLRKTIKILGLDFYVFLYSSLIASLILGLFFFQKIGGANIWEFFMVTSLILAITVSLNIALHLPKSKIITIALIFLIVAFSVPKWGSAIYHYFEVDYLSGFHGISNLELAGLNYIKNNTPENSLLLVVNQSEYVRYASVVSILTGRDLFFSGEGVSQQITPEILRRRAVYKFVITEKDDKKIVDVLKANKINYVYFYKNSIISKSLQENILLKKVFFNNVMQISKVD